MKRVINLVVLMSVVALILSCVTISAAQTASGSAYYTNAAPDKLAWPLVFETGTRSDNFLNPKSKSWDNRQLTARSAIGIVAMVFLTLLLTGRLSGMLTDLLFGFIDPCDDRTWNLSEDTKAIDKAARLFRNGKCRRAMRLCNRIIASNSQYASTAATLVYWIENPGSLKFFSPPRITIKLKESYSI